MNLSRVALPAGSSACFAPEGEQTAERRTDIGPVPRTQLRACVRHRTDALRDAAYAGAQPERSMSLGTILLIVLILMLIGVFPTWPHSSSWGYGPSGGLGVVVVIVLVLLLMGRL